MGPFYLVGYPISMTPDLDALQPIDPQDLHMDFNVGTDWSTVTTTAVQWNTVVTINFSHPEADARAGACGFNITISAKSLTDPPYMTPPKINSVTTTQPTDCFIQAGSITFNATGVGTVEYSIDGNTFQLANTFNNVDPGNYNVAMQMQSNIGCLTIYGQNPVMINPALGMQDTRRNLDLTGMPSIGQINRLFMLSFEHFGKYRINEIRIN